MPSHFFFKRYFQIRLPKFSNSSDELFLVVHPNFFIFRIFSNFTKMRSLDAPPMLHHVPLTTFFSSFLSHLPTFVYENWPLGCPPGWMPGAVVPFTPPSACHCIQIIERCICWNVILN